jgi:hypothetical protein
MSAFICDSDTIDLIASAGAYFTRKYPVTVSLAGTARIKRLFTPGLVVMVTNHYINRPNHPCFGTRLRTVAGVTGSHLHFCETGPVPWPKAAQVRSADGVVQFFGGGAGQRPEELFLTIEVHESPRC